VAQSTVSDIATRLREHGLRVTSQRRAIFAAFSGQEGAHLTVDEVFQRARSELPELSRATVYNSLAEFVKVGLLRVVDSPGALCYETIADDDHHHFRCLACGVLYDIRPQGVGGLVVSDSGFVVERAQVLLEGWCPNCGQSASSRLSWRVRDRDGNEARLAKSTT
jgi:Fur family transcriptional regulator, stress-responsive regulator